MSRHPVALAVGVAVAAVGIAAAVAPSLLGPLPAAGTLVGAVGALAVVYAAVTLSGRRRADRRTAPDPEPERRPAAAPPGADLDRLLAAAGGSDDRSHQLRRELRDAAVRTVRRREDCDVPTARAAVEDGTWTDDPVAASYFTDGPVEVPGDELGLSDRLRYRVSERERQALAARRVADEVAAATEVGG